MNFLQEGQAHEIKTLYRKTPGVLNTVFCNW